MAEVVTNEALHHLLQRSLAEIKRLKAELGGREVREREPLAIVGLGCRFPGRGGDPDGLWRDLCEEVDVIRKVPAERWPADLLPADWPGARWGGFLEGVDRFDAAFFGISPREARSMDPQQRLVLEVAWEALERAGCPPSELRGSRTGVFLGMAMCDYQERVGGEGLDALDAYAVTGGESCFAAGRTSYALGLSGPSLVVSTACSSSLVAIDLACRSLRGRQCDLALAGGVSLLLSPATMLKLARTGALSPDGRCRAFDALANGFVRSEGCGLLVLKRLSDAARDGDLVWALIRGSAVNQDGRSDGLTAPSGKAQAELVREALASAGVAPADVGYVEAHGAGTPLGDPIEFEALKEVLGGARADGSGCALGSIKTNLGHLEAAAGVAGLIKVVLALRHEAIPRSLHFQRLNPRMSLAGTPFSIPRSLTPWERRGKPRIAGVSSFGMSGTNAHVVLEEAPAPAAAAQAERRLHLLVLSGRTPEALREQAERFAGHLEGHPEQALGDVCHTANTRRTRFDHRLAAVGGTREALAEELRRVARGEEEETGCRVGRAGAAPGKVAFLFPGQGPQYVGMGRGLYDEEPAFREVIQRCDAHARGLLDRPLLSVLYPEDGASPIDESLYTHPALFALECAVAELWRSRGVVPDLVAGHSLGEYAAAVTAGVMPLEEGLDLVITRGRLLSEVPGAMAVVRASLEEVLAAIAPWADKVAIAAVNAPEQIVISGEREAVALALAALQGRGVEVRELAISIASHSPRVEPILEAFEAAAGRVRFAPARVPLVSGVTGRRIGDELCAASYWRRQIREPVRFAESIRTLRDEGAALFVEIGPHTSSLSMGAACVALDRGAWIPSLRRGQDDLKSFLEAMGALVVQGAAIAPAAFARGFPGRPVELPTYPFQRERFWIELGAGAGVAAPRGIAPAAADVGAGAPSSQEIQLDPAEAPELGDHRVQGVVVLPAAAHLELGLAAARARHGDRARGLREVRFERALAFPEGGPQRVQIALQEEGPGVAAFRISSRGGGPGLGAGGWTLHTSGQIALEGEGGAAPAPLEAIRARLGERVQVEAFYEALEARGISYGPRFRGIEALWRGPGEALARVRLAAGASRGASTGGFAPALLDACLQALFAAGLGGAAAGPCVPVSLRELRVYADLEGEVLSHALARPDEGDVRVLDGDGRILAEVLGLRVQAIAAEVREEDDWLQAITWQRLPDEAPRVATRSASATSPAWLLLADAGGAADALRAALEARGHAALTVARGEGGVAAPRGRLHVDPASPAAIERLLGEAFAGGRPCAGVVCLWALDAAAPGAGSTEELARGQRALAGGVLHLVQALSRLGWRDRPRLWLITRGAQAVTADAPPVAVAQASLWGLGRTIPYEHPELGCTLVDLDPASEDLEGLARTLEGGGPDDQVALRGEGALAARLGRGALDEAAAEVLEAVGSRPFGEVAVARVDPCVRVAAGAGRLIRERDATYLVTGGLSGLGLSAAAWLVGQGARHLVLIGRRGAPASAGVALAAMAAAGADVTVAAADVADRGALARVLADVQARLPPLRGVIHAAGVLRDAMLAEQTPEHFEEVMAPKVLGAWNLHTLTSGTPLDLFVLYSSAAALLGSPGQANHAAANAFLDGLAHHRRALGLPALSVNWGAFSEVGTVAKLGAEGASLSRRGMATLTPAQGLATLERLLAQPIAQMGVARIDLRQWIEFFPSVAASPTFSGLAARGAAAGPARGGLRQAMDAAPPEQRGALVEAAVIEAIARVLHINAARVVRSTALADLGVDSLIGLELRNRLENATGLKLPATLFWTYPSVGSLAGHLTERVSGAPARAAEPPAPAAPGGDAITAAIEDLSEEEAEALMAEKLAALEERLALMADKLAGLEEPLS